MTVRSYFTELTGLVRDKGRLYGRVPWEHLFNYTEMPEKQTVPPKNIETRS